MKPENLNFWKMEVYFKMENCEHKQQIQGWTGTQCFQGDTVIVCMDCGCVKNISQGDKEFKSIK